MLWHGSLQRQCTQSKETCGTCGQSFPDLKQHLCSNQLSCIRCGGEYLSNVTSYPVVKQFSAALTKNLLSTNYKTVKTGYSFNYDAACNGN